MKTALLFPGQGSQHVGMGRSLAENSDLARRTYAEADDALGFSLSKLCLEGPEDALTLTQHAQPAILTTSIAMFRGMHARGLSFDVVAGHSLGEWSALVAAGALSFQDAVRLTHLRGKFMQEAVPVGQGAMAALLGLDVATVRTACENASRPDEPVAPANLNGGGQIVISGHVAAIARAIEEAKKFGAKRALKLQVSAPFHCALMEPAAERLRDALAPITVTAPHVPVISNVTAEPTQDPARIKELLVAQVTSAVRWEESVQSLAGLGVTEAYEVGPGSVLRGLVKRIDPRIEVRATEESS